MTPERDWHIAALPGALADAAARLNAADLPTRWSAADFRDAIDDPAMICLAAFPALAHPPVAEADLLAVGLVRSVADEAEVLSLAVAGDARRRGIGRALLAELLAELSQRSVRRLFLEVAANNAGAIALYRKAGFRDIGTRPHYYDRDGETVDARLMACDLTPHAPATPAP